MTSCHCMLTSTQWRRRLIYRTPMYGSVCLAASRSVPPALSKVHASLHSASVLENVVNKLEKYDGPVPTYYATVHLERCSPLTIWTEYWRTSYCGRGEHLRQFWFVCVSLFSIWRPVWGRWGDKTLIAPIRSMPPGKVNLAWLWLRQGTFTCVGWQVYRYITLYSYRYITLGGLVV